MVMKGWVEAQNYKGGIIRYLYEKVKALDAAEGGDVKAQFSLAQCYDCGYGITPNREKAKYWFRKAAEQGDQDAKKELLRLESDQD